MQLHKYLNKIQLLFSAAGIMVSFFLLTLNSSESDGYSSYQHPFLTLLLIGFYVLIIAKLDFTNTMFVIRFKSKGQCMLHATVSLCLFGWLFYSILFAFFLALSFWFTATISVSSAVLCYIYTLLTLFFINVFYVVLSFKWSKLFTRIVLYSLMFLGFAMNFSGDIFIRYNFFFFNMYTYVNQGILTSSLATYAFLIFLLTLILQKRDREL